MYNIVYQITNLINGKIYIGIHKTNNKDDGYMGSGKLIKRAIEKYGIENFSKTILFESSNYEECRIVERNLVDNEFCKRENTYNISIGGGGGNTWAGMSDIEISNYKKKLSEQNSNRYNDLEYLNNHRSIMSDTWKNPVIRQSRIDSIAAGVKKYHENKSPEEKQLFSESVRMSWNDENKRVNRLNSMRTDEYRQKQKDKIFITNGISNKKINKTEEIPIGWRRGKVNKSR